MAAVAAGFGINEKIARKWLVDNNMHVPALAAPVAGYAMPNPLETRHFLDIAMEQFSRALALIAAEKGL